MGSPTVVLAGAAAFGYNIPVHPPHGDRNEMTSISPTRKGGRWPGGFSWLGYCAVALLLGTPARANPTQPAPTAAPKPPTETAPAAAPAAVPETAPATAPATAPEAKPTPDAPESKEPPKIPEPAILAAAHFLLMKDERIVGSERYKIVRSRYSGIVFASGMQQRFGRGLTDKQLEKLTGLSGKKRKRQVKKLRTKREVHHLEFAQDGGLKKFKTWTRKDSERTYVVLIPKPDGFTRRVETLSKQRVRKIAAATESVPFLADQLFLVRLAWKRASVRGGTIPVIDPATGKTSEVSFTTSPEGEVLVGGAGIGGKLELDVNGRINTYTYNGTLYQRGKLP